MAIDSGATKKEATILGLSNEIRDVLYDFQSRLDSSFTRNPKDECKAEAGKGILDSVLDEIIDNLEADKAWLQRIMSFISSNVLPKIS